MFVYFSELRKCEPHQWPFRITIISASFVLCTRCRRRRRRSFNSRTTRSSIRYLVPFAVVRRVRVCVVVPHECQAHMLCSRPRTPALNVPSIAALTQSRCSLCQWWWTENSVWTAVAEVTRISVALCVSFGRFVCRAWNKHSALRNRKSNWIYVNVIKKKQSIETKKTQTIDFLPLTPFDPFDGILCDNKVLIVSRVFSTKIF